MTPFLRRKFEAFVREVPPAAAEMGPDGDSGRVVYSLSDWLSYAGDDLFQASMLEPAARTPLIFLWRPRTVPYFWDMVRMFHLRVLGDFGPATAGLTMCPGDIFRPRGIIYDHDAVRGICRRLYWDSFEMRVSRTERLQERLFALEMGRRVWGFTNPAGLDSPMVVRFLPSG